MSVTAEPTLHKKVNRFQSYASMEIYFQFIYASIMTGLTRQFIVFCVLGLVGGRLLTPELLQLQSFIKLSQSSRDSEYLNRTSGCILQQGDRGSPRRPCKKIATSVMKEFGIERKMSSPNSTCQYAVTSTKVMSNQVFISAQAQYTIEITITQANCTLGWTSAIGGSSLRVEIDRSGADQNNQHSMTYSCLLQQVDAADYTYHCPLTPEPTTLPVDKECNALCGLSVSAVVDYEHYSAFDEVVGLTYGLNTVVISQSLPEMMLTVSQSVIMNRKQKKTSLKCCNTLSTALTPNSHNLFNSTQLRAALDRFDAVYFVGASHMRYLWDSVVHVHYNASALLTTLPQHHADETVANTWYVNNYFSMELPALIRDICSANSVFAPSSNTNRANTPTIPSTVVFVLQTGSWDLDYNPARNMLMFPNSSSAVVQAVLEMAENGYRCNGRRVEVVWLTTVPIPECEESPLGFSENVHHYKHKLAASGAKRREKSCFDKGYRNNHAIQAVNQYFVREFQTVLAQNEYSSVNTGTNKPNLHAQQKKINQPRGATAAPSSAPTRLPARNLRIIDAFDMIYPHRNDNLCGLHYLCCRHSRRGPVQMASSPGGEKLLGSVLSTLTQLGQQL